MVDLRLRKYYAIKCLERGLAATQRLCLARLAVAVVLMLHGVLLAWIAKHNSVVFDEPAHLVAGLAIWKYGMFDLFRVNPPLVRAVATFPVALLPHRNDWSGYADGAAMRVEHQLGVDFIRANTTKWFSLFVVARCMLIPLSIVGGYVCYLWARDMYGRGAGACAACLWAFSPDVLAWGSTLTPDVAAAALGVAAGYFYWRWLQHPSWGRALVAGLTLGFAELAKLTWIVLFVLWPLLWAVGRLRRSMHGSRSSWCREAGQVALVLLVGVYIINVGYAFEDSFRRLGDFVFVSHTLAGVESRLDGGPGGNRFSDTLFGRIPIPLPANYLRGIDLLKSAFESAGSFYLRGAWRDGVCWYYYLYGLAIKMPLGTLLLGVLAFGLTGWSIGTKRSSAEGYWGGWKSECVLLAPALVVLVFASCQPGWYMRYVLPVYPFWFVWVSKVGRSFELKSLATTAACTVAIVWSVASSLSVFPHSMSYFNALVGGPRGGHWHLLEGNIEWGQDLWYLRPWIDAHPEARPLFVECFSAVPLEYYGIEFPRVSHDGPRAGWYAVSAIELHAQPRLSFLHKLKPIAMAGYSIYIYRVGTDEPSRRLDRRVVTELEAVEESRSSLQERRISHGTEANGLHAH